MNVGVSQEKATQKRNMNTDLQKLQYFQVVLGGHSNIRIEGSSFSSAILKLIINIHCTHTENCANWLQDMI